MLAPFPKWVTIDVHDYCDASCAYCPYTRLAADPDRKQGVMELGLFTRLLDECADNRKHLQAIRFGNLAESLVLDVAWLAMEEAIKRDLPLYIDSNMTHMDEAALDKLDAMGWTGKLFGHVQPDMGVDFDDAAINYNRAALRWGERVSHVEILNPRKWAGDPTISYRRAVRCGANRLNESMIIGWDGTVQQCCVDADRLSVVGNVSANTMAEVWTGPTFRAVREALALGGNAVCCSCEWGMEA